MESRAQLTAKVSRIISDRETPFPLLFPLILFLVIDKNYTRNDRNVSKASVRVHAMDRRYSRESFVNRPLHRSRKSAIEPNRCRCHQRPATSHGRVREDPLEEASRVLTRAVSAYTDTRGECNYRCVHGIRGRRGIHPGCEPLDLRGFEATIMARNRCALARARAGTRVITRNNARLHTHGNIMRARITRRVPG